MPPMLAIVGKKREESVLSHTYSNMSDSAEKNI